MRVLSTRLNELTCVAHDEFSLLIAQPERLPQSP